MRCVHLHPSLVPFSQIVGGFFAGSISSLQYFQNPQHRDPQLDAVGFTGELIYALWP